MTDVKIYANRLVKAPLSMTRKRPPQSDMIADEAPSASGRAPGRADQIAIALKYDQQTSGAPVITAKGHGRVAEQILDLAFRSGVKVCRDTDLVTILDQVDVESEIPLEAFAAVAEILTYIYRANHLFGDGGGYEDIKDEIRNSETDETEPPR